MWEHSAQQVHFCPSRGSRRKQEAFGVLRLVLSRSVHLIRGRLVTQKQILQEITMAEKQNSNTPFQSDCLANIQHNSSAVLPGWDGVHRGTLETDTCGLRSAHPGHSQPSNRNWDPNLGEVKRGSNPHCSSSPARSLNTADSSRAVSVTRLGPTTHLWPLTMH